MPLVLPALSQTEWNNRLYDITIGGLFPIIFSFSPTNGWISGDGGTFSYIQQIYTVTNLQSIAAIEIEYDYNFSVNLNASGFIVSLASTVTMVDASGVADEGNIIFQRWNSGASTGSQRLVGRKFVNYYPDNFLLATGQQVYINLIGIGSTGAAVGGSTSGETMSLILHTLQTGLQI